jgi:trigger factor
LNIDKQPRDDHQVRLVVEFEPEVMEKFRHQGARKISEKAKIPGFRPGKAPYEVIKRFYGDEAINDKAIELMIDELYPKILEQAEIKPGGSGQLDEVVSMDPPKLAFVVPLEPEVELGDYQSIRQEYILEAVTDEDVDRVIRNIQNNYATAEPADRPIQTSDLVYVKMSGTLTQPAEGEDPEAVRDSGYQFIIGDKDDNWPFEGFSKELESLSSGDEKSVVHTFAEDDANTTLQGKVVEFHIHVQAVKSMKLPELNDEFAKSVGGSFNTMEELQKAIRTQLETNERDEYNDNYSNELLEKVIAVSTIKYPPQILEDEVEHLLEHFEQDLKKQKMEMETYLKTREMDRDTFIENDIRPAAITRLEQKLVLDKISEAEKIQINMEELQTTLTQTMMQLQQNDPDVRKMRGKQAQQLVSTIMLDSASRLMNRDTLQRLKAIAVGEYPPPPEAVVSESTSGETEPEQAIEPEQATEPVIESETSESAPAVNENSTDQVNDQTTANE